MLTAYVDTTPAGFSDEAKGAQIAGQMIGQGTDVLYAAAGTSGLGIIRQVNQTEWLKRDRLPTGVSARPAANAVSRAPKSASFVRKCGQDGVPVFFIGVDNNQNLLGDTDNDPHTLNHGLTSMVKRMDVLVYTVINYFTPGSWLVGPREVGLDARWWTMPLTSTTAPYWGEPGAPSSRASGSRS